MNPIGIVAEFNPFHIGHEYLLKQVKELYPASPIIICMSGNFMQRGEPAITNKWLRAEMAIKCGADIVFELPTVFASSSADLFAAGSVRLLDSIGLISNIVCGAETANLAILQELADIIDNDTFKNDFHQEINQGCSHANSFAHACAAAAACININSTFQLYENVLRQPNNLLAIHYLKAIGTYSSAMQLYPIARMQSDICISAAKIRRLIVTAGDDSNLHEIAKFLPATAYKLLTSEQQNSKDLLIDDTAMWNILRHIIITSSPETIANIGDISEGLENRIITSFKKTTSLQEAIETIKTKRYTRTRIQRCLMQLLLGITKKDLQEAYTSGPSYLRLLGASETGRLLLHNIKKTCRIPLITRSGKKYLEKHIELLKDPVFRRQLDLDIAASDIYTNLFPHRSIAEHSDSHKKIQIG